MSDIIIQPIFNQSAPGIWQDFLRIRMDTWMHHYNIPMSSDDIARAHQDYIDDWNRYSRNFAFGAYDENRMVGCVNGGVRDSIGYLYNLYVLPEYQHQRIGRRLLHAAHNAAAIMYAHRMELISLSRARSFYVGLGYKCTDWTDFYKRLECPKCSIVPVFRCNPSIVRKCNLTPESARQIKSMHLPMFASYDANSDINGYGLLGADGEPIVCASKTHAGGITRRSLERVLDAHRIHLENIAKLR